MEMTEGKMKATERKAAHAISTAQVAMEVVPEHSKQIQELQK